MAYDFPASPIDGQTYSPAGGPDYVYSTSTGAWLIKTSGSNSAFVAKAGDVMTGALEITDATASTTPTTGALKVTGGLGVQGAINTATPAVTDNTTKAATTAHVKLYAAPFDALSYSGMQINGSFDVYQNRVYGQNAADTHTADGWRSSRVGTSVGQTYVYVTGGLNGFPSCLISNISTAQTSLGATDHVAHYQMIEGYRIARLEWGTVYAKPITIGFWTAHTRTGLHTGIVKNAAGDRTLAFSYTQTATGTFQFNTVSVPGCTTGTWAKDHTTGLYVMFCQASGTTYLAPGFGTWYNTNYVGGVGQVNGVGATSDVFRLTGVIVLPGLYAPSEAQSPLIMRSFDQELMICRRYYRSSYEHGVTPGTVTGVGQVMYYLEGATSYAGPLRIVHEPMRAAPAVTIYSPATGASGKFRVSDTSTDVNAVAASISTRGFYGFVNGVAIGLSNAILGQYVEDARL